jgi:hypothetical protein
VYAEPPGPERTSALPDLLLRPHEHVRKLDPDLVAGLLQAAHVADYDRLKELTAQIPRQHAVIGEALGELVERYSYDEIEAILRT